MNISVIGSKGLAKELGKKYELHSNVKIPIKVKKWLEKKGITYKEH